MDACSKNWLPMDDLVVAESDLLLTLAGNGVVLPLLMDDGLYPMFVAWRFDVDSEPFPVGLS